MVAQLAADAEAAKSRVEGELLATARMASTMESRLRESQTTADAARSAVAASERRAYEVLTQQPCRVHVLVAFRPMLPDCVHQVFVTCMMVIVRETTTSSAANLEPPIALSADYLVDSRDDTTCMVCHAGSDARLAWQ